jgi:probable DNA metabolism protein
MRRIALDSETDWYGWRSATRALVLAGIAPDQVQWTIRTHPHDGTNELPDGTGGFNVPRALVALGALAFQARDRGRFDLLYRLVWRANAGEKVLELSDDADLLALQRLAYAVRAEAHRMRTMIRFTEVEGEAGHCFLGWYGPAHYVLEANAQLMTRRFPNLAFSILTPDGGAHWNTAELRFGEGAPVFADDDALTRWWHAHHARLWREARVGTSIAEAEPLDEAPRPPDRPALGPVVLPLRADPQLLEATQQSAECHRCPLYAPATQTVFGEGPEGASVLFVGEQPGDQEDVIGRPFVGPAGQMLDRAMEEAGIDRRTVYVTNSVKHFKFTPRGKRRIHQSPDAPEIQACRFWLDVERVQLRPKLLVLMGGTAARAVLGRPVTIGRERGRPFRMEDGQMAFVTVHPSFLLRVPDEDAKAREYRAFVRDLQEIRKLMG